MNKKQGLLQKKALVKQEQYKAWVRIPAVL